MERLKEIKEKGVDSATPEDILIGLGVITEFINTNPEAQNLIKNFELTGNFDVEGVGNYILSIANGKSEYAQKSISEPSFSIFANLKSLTEILIGQLDASMAFITGDIEVAGDFGKMVDFFEVMELVYNKLELVEKEERTTLVDAKTMRKFYNLYMEFSTDKSIEIDPNDIPLIFDIFCTFANLNKEAIDVMEDEEFLVQMVIPDVNTYVVKAENGKVSWSEGEIENPSLQFVLELNTAADVFLSGDAASAFLDGKIEASGNIAEALVLNDLVEIFLEMLPFTEKEE